MTDLCGYNEVPVGVGGPPRFQSRCHATAKQYHSVLIISNNVKALLKIGQFRI